MRNVQINGRLVNDFMLLFVKKNVHFDYSNLYNPSASYLTTMWILVSVTVVGVIRIAQDRIYIFHGTESNVENMRPSYLFAVTIANILPGINLITKITFCKFIKILLSVCYPYCTDIHKISVISSISKRYTNLSLDSKYYYSY